MSIEKALIGNLKNIKRTVVISPVFYPNRFGLKGEKSPVGNIIVNDKFSYIKTYPAPVWIHDTVLCLKKCKVKQIIFIGTGGSLSSKYKIGDIVTAKGKYKSSDVLTDAGIPEASVLSLDSLLSETKENIRKFKRQGYDVIDLEVSSFYKACKKIKKRGLALLIIQDTISKPFYKPLPPKDEERLKIGIEKLINICMMLSENQ